VKDVTSHGSDVELDDLQKSYPPQTILRIYVILIRYSLMTLKLD